MKSTFIAVLGFLLLTISSCSNQIHFTKYIDSDSSLELTINKIDDKTGLTESEKKIIDPKSEKFIKFINWCNNNSSDWKTASESYSPKATISQKDFQLLC